MPRVGYCSHDAGNKDAPYPAGDHGSVSRQGVDHPYSCSAFGLIVWARHPSIKVVLNVDPIRSWIGRMTVGALAVPACAVAVEERGACDAQSAPDRLVNRKFVRAVNSC